MAEVTPIGTGEPGSYLCSVALYRNPDGSIRAVIENMPVAVIEAEETITGRFWKTARWCFEAGLDLMRQGLRFDDEHRMTTAQNDGDNS